jgi:serine phosphatase RsbU (regulator of sigma subunit)
VVFASDGISEAANAEQEHFGTERLISVLQGLPVSATADEICAAVLKATDEFSGHPEEAHDDRTLIVFRVLKPSATSGA